MSCEPGTIKISCHIYRCDYSEKFRIEGLWANDRLWTSDSAVYLQK